MPQHQLDRAVARVTGESLDTIQHRGFIFVGIQPRRPSRSSRRRQERSRASYPEMGAVRTSRQ